MKLQSVVPLVLVLAVVSVLARSAAGPSTTPMYSQWQLVASSDLIARARLQVPLTGLKESLRTKNYNYMDVQVTVEETVKGSRPQQPLPVRYYTEPAEYSPSADLLEKCNGEDVIVFILQVDEAEVAGNYFAGYTPAAVSIFNAEEFSKIAREVDNQQEIAMHFAELPVGKATGADARIRDLFDMLTVVQTQDAAWERLLKLSSQDAPALVRLMNDQRPLAKRYAYIPTPKSFEATAQYGPPRIVEAASILLSYLTTTTSFRPVANGGSGRERQADVDGWRVWSWYNFTQ